MWTNHSDRGTYAQFKRRRNSQSSEEGEINKAKRVRSRPADTNQGQSSSESVDLLTGRSESDTKSDIDRVNKMTTLDLSENDIDKIVSRISCGLQRQYDETTKRIFEGMKEVQKRVNTLEDNDRKHEADIGGIKTNDKKQDAEIELMKGQIDDYQQQEKDNNIVVTGLKVDQLSKESAIEMLNDKLEMNLTNTDVQYVLKLKTRDDQPHRLRIVFLDKARKSEVMKRKTKLKDQDIWLADELTKFRIDLAYAARKAAKERKIAQTWVHDSKVFIKRNTSDRPILVKYKKDIPK
jgi:hypothetical protein